MTLQLSILVRILVFSVCVSWASLTNAQAPEDYQIQISTTTKQIWEGQPCEVKVSIKNVTTKPLPLHRTVMGLFYETSSNGIEYERFEPWELRGITPLSPNPPALQPNEKWETTVWLI